MCWNGRIGCLLFIYVFKLILFAVLCCVALWLLFYFFSFWFSFPIVSDFKSKWDRINDYIYKKLMISICDAHVFFCGKCITHLWYDISFVALISFQLCVFLFFTSSGHGQNQKNYKSNRNEHFGMFHSVVRLTILNHPNKKLLKPLEKSNSITLTVSIKQFDIRSWSPFSLMTITVSGYFIKSMSIRQAINYIIHWTIWNAYLEMLFASKWVINIWRKMI